jgi:hypothetical protein
VRDLPLVVTGEVNIECPPIVALIQAESDTLDVVLFSR